MLMVFRSCLCILDCWNSFTGKEFERDIRFCTDTQIFIKKTESDVIEQHQSLPTTLCRKKMQPSLIYLFVYFLSHDAQLPIEHD